MLVQQLPEVATATVQVMGLKGLWRRRKAFSRRTDTRVGGFVTLVLLLIGRSGPVVAQTAPAFNWIAEVDHSGLAYTLFAGLGTDSQGNAYVVGSTKSPNFTVQAAVQDHLASPG